MVVKALSYRQIKPNLRITVLSGYSNLCCPEIP
jgi:hypothetical protein